MAECNLSLRVLPRIDSPGLCMKERKALVYQVVDKVLEYISQQGVPYFTGPSETTLEGSLDDLLRILGEAQRICLREGAEQVFTIAHFSYASHDGINYQERLDRTAEHRS